MVGYSNKQIGWIQGFLIPVFWLCGLGPGYGQHCASSVAWLSGGVQADGSWQTTVQVCLAGTQPTRGISVTAFGSPFLDALPGTLTSAEGQSISLSLTSGTAVATWGDPTPGSTAPVFVDGNSVQPQCFTLTLTTAARPDSFQLTGPEAGLCTWSLPACTATPGIKGPIRTCTSQTLTYERTYTRAGSQYFWSILGQGIIVNGTATTPTIEVNFPTSGTVRVLLAEVSACGVVRVDTLEVQVVPTPPPLVSNGQFSVCAGREVTFPEAALAGFVSTWASPSGLDPTISGNPATIRLTENGYYRLTRTLPGTGCSFLDSILVNISGQPAGFQLIPEAICTGNAINVQTTVALNPNAPATWLWTWGDGTTTSAPMPLPHTYSQPGIYTVTLETISADGCRDTASQQVTVYPPPVAFVEPQTICSPGQNVTLDGSTFSTAPTPTVLTTYSWDLNDDGSIDGTGTVFSFVPTAAGVYPIRLKVGTDAGCSDDTLISIEVRAVPNPALVLSKPVLCQSETLTIALSTPLPPGTGASWVFGTNAIVETLGTPQAGPFRVRWPSAGVYGVGVTLDYGGCIQNLQQTVSVLPSPQLAPVSDAFICYSSGQTVTVSLATLPPVTDGSTYSWAPPTGIVSQTPSGNQTVLQPVSTTTYTVQAVNQIGCASQPLTLTIHVGYEPVITIATPVLTTCIGQAGAQLAATVSPLNTPADSLSWAWTPTTGLSDPFSLTPIASPNQTTVYTLTATGAYGCATTATALVQVYAPPIAQAGPTVQRCSADPIFVTLSGTGVGQPGEGFSYSWSPGATLNDSTLQNPTAQPTETTVYTLTVRSLQSGCLSEVLGPAQTQIVEVVPSPVAKAHLTDTAYICTGSNILLAATVAGGGPNYTYEWSPTTGLSNPSALNPVASPAFTTTYLFKARSNGCESPPSYVTVVVQPGPTVSVPTSIDLCAGSQAVITPVVVSSSSGPYTYTWAPAAGLSATNIANPTVTAGTVNQTYTLTVSGAGCVGAAVDSVRIQVRPQPAVDANPLGLTYRLCADTGSIQLQGSIVPITATTRFWWSPGNFLSDSTSLNPSILNLTESRWFYLYAQEQTCQVLDSVLIEVLTPLRPRLQNPPDTVCAGTPFRLEASAGVGEAKYEWRWTTATDTLTTSGSNPGFVLDGSTTFTLTVSEGGCTATLTHPVVILPAPNASFEHSLNQGCVPTTVAFRYTGTQTTAWVWDFGDGTAPSNLPSPVHTYWEAGVYTTRVIAVAASGCRDSAIATVTVANRPVLQLATPLPESLFVGETLVLSVAPGSGQKPPVAWYLGSELLSVGDTFSYACPTSGTFELQVIGQSAEGCVPDPLRFTLRILPSELTIPNVFTPNGDGVNDDWAPSWRLQPVRAFEVYDAWGNRVHVSRADAPKTWQPEADVPAGVYFYSFTHLNRKYSGSLTLVR
jgi:gliding motility-associated-like protein